MRCALTSSVMSSKVTTEPCSSWLCAFAGDAHGEIALRALTLLSVIWSVMSRLPCFCARFSTAPNSGTASASGWPVRSASFMPEQRLGRAVDEGDAMPSASRPTTPAVTPDSTASMKRRRSSSLVLALTSSSRWLLSSEVMVLKVEPSTARSPSAGSTSTFTARLPSRDLLGRADQPADRRHQAVGEPHADPDGRRAAA